MASIQELKDKIGDLHTLADHLGLVRPGGNSGNYRSPHHDDKSPSLEVRHDGSWTDYSRDVGGDAVDLVEYVTGGDTQEAITYLHDWLGLEFGQKKPQSGPKSRAEWIADNCRKDDVDWKKKAIDYLVQERGILEAVARRAVEKGTIGWNVWTSDKKQPGEVGYGGEGIAFLVKCFHTGRIMAVDMRYLDPELNGGVKTQSQGEKEGYPWFSDLHRLKKAKTVYIVESAINVLSVESCEMPYTAAIAIRGNARVVPGLDLHWLHGKKVIICTDNDEPDEYGECAGQQAAWALHEKLTALNIAAHIVDQSTWEVNDVNDFLIPSKRKGDKEDALNELERSLKCLEQWAIAGLPGQFDKDKKWRKPRVFLPPHDYGKYWLFRPKEDFTTFVSKIEKDDDGGADKLSFQDLCGFRVAGLSRVTIASATATMSGATDSQPRTVFAVAVQTPRHGAVLLRRVFDDETLHNVDQWRKFGPVFSPSNFSRMLTILERGAHLGARHAINFVGLAWRGKQLQVNEGTDTYFTDPEKQCPYHNLTFPSGSPYHARRVVNAYQQTFKHNAALQMLTWALGGHLKALLGYWPHLTLQAPKASGKSTLIKAMETTIAFNMLSGQSLQTEFRLLTSIAHTSHPIGWEELSARGQNVIDKAVAMLQESYQYTVTRRGSDMTEYLLSAPVLLAGEDVPVNSLIGKITRVSLMEKGPMLPDDLPQFPVREWLTFLAGHTRAEIKNMHRASLEFCRKNCRATGHDHGASRMVENYAAVLLAWKLLAEFSGIESNQGGFVHDLLKEMNDHIAETSGDREPWVWIMETLLNEMASGKYRQPYKVDRDEENTLYLAVLPSQVMHHLKTDPGLRATWDGLPVKSPRVFKKQLTEAGVILAEDVSATVNGKRQTHMIALSAEKLEEFGLHVAEPEQGHGPEHGAA